MITQPVSSRLIASGIHARAGIFMHDSLLTILFSAKILGPFEFLIFRSAAEIHNRELLFLWTFVQF